MNERNPYIVTKALNSYLKGSVIIAISGHLVTTTDAVVVSWLIGSKAFTAVNIVIPILTVFSFIMIMLGTGASISISKALGNRDKNKVNLSFSSSVVGSVIISVASALLTYKYTSEIIRYLVHGDLILYDYALKYLQTFCYAIPFLIVGGVISSIVRTDGNTKVISIAVWIGILINILLDIIFIRYLGLGIQGAAWATTINYFIVLIICLSHFFTRSNTIRWSIDFKDYFLRIIKNCRLGFSTSLNTLLLGVSLFVINSIMLHYIGSEGIYCWAVCYQIFLILQMLLSGVDTSIFSIGGVLLGEDDVTGLYFLYKRSAIYLIISVIILSLAIIIFPEFFGSIFGNRGEDKLDLLPDVLKIFSLFLFPYAMMMQVRSIYTILERGFLSLVICISSFALMILFVYLSALHQEEYLWWSFPFSSWILFVVLFIYTTILHFCNKNLRIYSLIPKNIPGPIYNASIPLDEKAVGGAEDNMATFLRKNDIDEGKISYSVSVTGEIMSRMLERLIKDHKKKRYFDINVRIRDAAIIVILKDDGNRIDRESEDEIVSGLRDDFFKGDKPDMAPKPMELATNYFYMNEQNTITLTFK